MNFSEYSLQRKGINIIIAEYTQAAERNIFPSLQPIQKKIKQQSRAVMPSIIPYRLNAKRNIIIIVHVLHPVHVHEPAVSRVESRHSGESAIVKSERFSSRI